ncbi:hypothetical protein RhiirA5_416723 [Rhizophagus irregularis]|uniref:Uncharacterized protein n=1 Tax=Rhizophagus irregularis TaxID=588596 RepID=A0A2N0PP41_9GLOM|nr:hypothetical protein RhiirA5_416723 [Rhizophagus irregularis]PKC64470.1 hypothetical protein RhiirA1_462381 [Rhizophagus irregularis]
MDDNVDINNNNSETTINLLLQLLANPKILQQATTMITQQTPSAPNPVSIAAATSLTGVVNTSFPRGSIQNPITKEEWKQWKKTKQPNEDWKDFLHLPYDTYWTYRRNLRDRLNATCEKGKYASEQVPGKIQNVINSFKSDFPTFPISVGDFVLQKIIEDIVGNWGKYGFVSNIYIILILKISVVETERKNKVKEARIRGIPPPPKRKNITPPNSKRKKLMTNPSTQVSKILSNTVLPAENIETNNTDNIDVQLTHVTPSDVQEELEDTRNVQLYTHETPSNGNEKRTTTTRTRLEKTIRPPKKQSTTRKTYNIRNKSQK